MKLRSYDETDAPALASLFTDSVHGLARGEYDAKQRAAWAPRPPDLEAWRARLAGLATLVAEVEGTVAGFLSYDPSGHIELLYTSTEHGRRGVATALYRRVEAELVASGVEELTTEASRVARPFFERQGFRVLEEQHVERRGVSFQRYAMQKSVAPRGQAPPP